MRIIIIGAGDTGQSLAAKLVELRHDIVLIDKDPEKLHEASAHLDILTVEGNGANPAVPRRAELERADLWLQSLMMTRSTSGRRFAHKPVFQ